MPVLWQPKSNTRLHEGVIDESTITFGLSFTCILEASFSFCVNDLVLLLYVTLFRSISDDLIGVIGAIGELLSLHLSGCILERRL